MLFSYVDWCLWSLKFWKQNLTFMDAAWFSNLGSVSMYRYSQLPKNCGYCGCLYLALARVVAVVSICNYVVFIFFLLHAEITDRSLLHSLLHQLTPKSCQANPLLQAGRWDGPHAIGWYMFKLMFWMERVEHKDETHHINCFKLGWFQLKTVLKAKLEFWRLFFFSRLIEGSRPINTKENVFGTFVDL